MIMMVVTDTGKEMTVSVKSSKIRVLLQPGQDLACIVQCSAFFGAVCFGRFWLRKKMVVQEREAWYIARGGLCDLIGYLFELFGW